MTVQSDQKVPWDTCPKVFSFVVADLLNMT